METTTSDVVMLDAELLQLPEISPLAFKSYPHFPQTLFDQWLSLPDPNKLVPFSISLPISFAVLCSFRFIFLPFSLINYYHNYFYFELWSACDRYGNTLVVDLVFDEVIMG
jgi:hypothetical protein